MRKLVLQNREEHSAALEKHEGNVHNKVNKVSSGFFFLYFLLQDWGGALLLLHHLTLKLLRITSHHGRRLLSTGD